MPMSRTSSAARGPSGARKAATSKRRCRRGRSLRASPEARQRAEHAFGRDPQDDEQRYAEEQQPVFGKTGQELRQDHAHQRAGHRTKGPAGTAHDDDEQELDRLRE
jgi:hypothetical protein